MPARSRAWAGLEKPHGAYSDRVPLVRLTADRLRPPPPPRRLVLGAYPWRTAGPALRPAKLRASCSAKSAARRSGDGALPAIGAPSVLASELSGCNSPHREDAVDRALEDLTCKLDFTVGDDFQHEFRRRFKTEVHHESPSSRNSFFLLATFRRSLVRLTEESVGLILESCLGGHTPFFHVMEMSRNHCRFSVSCKAVGFFVYNLRRVIGSVFDVYFHLWSNGAPHWEKEK